MIEENELIMLVLGAAVLVFIWLNASLIRRVPGIKILLSSFSVMVAGFVFTIIEGLFLETVFNLLEHLCYAAASLLLLAWCYLIFAGKGKCNT